MKPAVAERSGVVRLDPDWTAVGSVVLVVGFLGALSQISPPFFGILLIVGSVLAVAVSVPLGVLGAVFDRRYDPERALAGLLGLIVACSTVAGVALAVFVDPAAAFLVAAAGIALGAFWWLLPVAAGVSLGRRWHTRTRYVVAAWPVSAVSGLAVFLAPAAVGRTNLTFLDGPLAAGLFCLLALVVALGPGLVGSGLGRLRGRSAG